MKILDINSQGNGVGRMEGKAVFVPGVIPGEEVHVSIQKREKRFDLATLSSVEVPSPHRRPSPCPHFLRCGGCDFLHMDYPEQLRCKQSIVGAALERIGGLQIDIQPILPSPQPFHYRNKASFPVDSTHAGYYRRGSKQIVEIDSCQLVHPRCQELFLALREWAKSAHIRHVVIRVSGRQTMATLVTDQKPFRQKQKLLDLLQPLGVDSIYLNYNTGQTILGAESELLFGLPQLGETLLSNRFPVSPASFLQVNPAQTERLYQTALQAFSLTGRRVLDGYCGIGTISLALAQQAKTVVGVELSASAVADARAAARDNGVTNVTFHQARVEQFLPTAEKFDVVFLDPPRAGLDQRVISTIAQQGIENIVYISCSPQTLARDLARFAAYGYHIKELTPVDMFPQTAHVECVAVMEKQD